LELVQAAQFTWLADVSDFKPGAGRIFDAARKTPQYVIRKGDLLVIHRASSPLGQGEAQLSSEQLDQLNQELEDLGRHGSKVIDELREARAR
jgi:hypothetical protein